MGREKAYKLDVTRLYLHVTYPPLHEFDLWIILGGRQGANDIADKEKQWI